MFDNFLETIYVIINLVYVLERKFLYATNIKQNEKSYRRISYDR